MATTTNYGWTTPDDTALVKDGAAAIRTLGSSVDTTTKNLNPETTLGDISYRSSTANVNTRLPLGTAGQVLKVNSGATAPEWATDATGMSNPMTTTGDTIYSSSGSTPARLAIGSTGNVLTVAGGVPTWAAPAAGGMTLLSTTTLTGSGNITISSISQDYVSLMMMVYGTTFVSASPNLYVRINGYSTGHYGSAVKLEGATAGATPLVDTAVWLSAGVGQVRQTGGLNSWTISFPDYTNTSHYKNFEFSGQWNSDASTICAISGGGALRQTAAITSFEINTSDTFSTGTVKIWGIK